MMPNGVFFSALLCYNSVYPDFVNSSRISSSDYRAPAEKEIGTECSVGVWRGAFAGFLADIAKGTVMEFSLHFRAFCLL